MPEQAQAQPAEPVATVPAEEEALPESGPPSEPSPVEPVESAVELESESGAGSSEEPATQRASDAQGSSESELAAALSEIVTIDLPQASAEDACGVPAVFTFWAGQHIDAGTVTVWNDEDSLFVRITTGGDWYLTESHLYVGLTFPDSIAPGQFPYKTDHDPAVNTYTYQVPLSWDPGTDLFILIHGVVHDTGEGGGTETAWGGDNPFEGPRWGFYIKYKIQECDEEPLPEPGIEVVKSADATEVPAGTLVNYTFVVTNIGETTLLDITVDDDHLGHIGDIVSLAPGDSETFTASAVLDETTTNTVVAAGEDEYGRVVADTDTWTVETFLPFTEPPEEEPPVSDPPAEPEAQELPFLPFTGADGRMVGLLAGLAVLFGLALRRMAVVLG